MNFESLLKHNAQTWFTDLGNEKKDTRVHLEENFKSAYSNSRNWITENMLNSEQTSVCAIDDRVMNSKINSLVNKFTASLNEIDKLFSDFKRSTEEKKNLEV